MMFPNISPIAFSFFGFEVRWYALAYIFGFVLAYKWTSRVIRRAPNNRLSDIDLDNIVSYMVCGVIIGGRLGYCLFYNFGHYSTHPLEILKVWQGGMSFHGGFIGSLVAMWLFARKYRQSFAAICDAFALAAPIGLLLGRLANFVNAELYGRPTTSVFGMIFPNSDGLPRHPSQLYEAAFEGLALFLILNYLFRRRAFRNRPGSLAFSFVLGYGIARFGVEFFRQPDEQIGYLAGGITMGQLLTLPIIIIGATGLIWLMLRPRKPALFFTSPALNSLGITHRFFTRQGGVSSRVFATNNSRYETSDTRENIDENRRRMLAEIDGKILVSVRQNHTADVVVIDKPNPDTAKLLDTTADGIITNQPGVAVGVMTADCVPVLVRAGDWVAAIHCGWQGIYGEIVHTTIEKLKHLGVQPTDIRVAIGACIKQKSYEVASDFKDKIVATNSSYAKFFKTAKNNKFLFDCTAYCVAKLRTENVPAKNIDTLPLDTYSNSDLFFSYRRSIQTGDHAPGNPIDEGRLISVIMKPLS